MNWGHSGTRRLWSSEHQKREVMLVLVFAFLSSEDASGSEVFSLRLRLLAIGMQIQEGRR